MPLVGQGEPATVLTPSVLAKLTPIPGEGKGYHP